MIQVNDCKLRVEIKLTWAEARTVRLGDWLADTRAGTAAFRADVTELLHGAVVVSLTLLHC